MLSIVLIDRIISYSDYLIYLICLLPGMIGCITTWICYNTAFSYNRFPEWVVLPWISFTGISKPESYIFAFGFSLSGFAVLLLHYLFNKKIINNKHIINISNLQEIYCLNKIPYFDYFIYFILRYTLISAAIGIITQSWINLDNQWLINFLSPKFQTMQWFTDWNAIIHISFAAILFFHNTWYYNLAVLLTFNYNNMNELKWSFYYKLFNFIIQCLSGIVCFWCIIIVSYIIDPYKHETLFYFGINIIGLCQYVSTASYCLFVASYAWDYYVVTNKHKIN